MSVRERRNRKDAKGKTPEQIRRGQAAHERAYARAIEGQSAAIAPAVGYLRRAHLMFTDRSGTVEYDIEP